MPLYDALEAAESATFSRGTSRAVFAAEGYARSTGKPGAIATSGPGATNLMTALRMRRWIRLPLVALPGRCGRC